MLRWTAPQMQGERGFCLFDFQKFELDVGLHLGGMLGSPLSLQHSMIQDKLNSQSVEAVQAGAYVKVLKLVRRSSQHFRLTDPGCSNLIRGLLCSLQGGTLTEHSLCCCPNPAITLEYLGAPLSQPCP